jgi:uncharacterized membrane protein
MGFKNGFLKSGQQAQSIIEYVLLVAVSIVVLLSLTFVRAARDNGFENHFNITKDYITSDAN